MRKITLFTIICSIVAACNFIPRSVASEIDVEYDTDAIVASDNYLTKNFEFATIEAIECSFPCDINYSQGSQNVELKAPDNVINNISLKLRNGVLVVSSEKRIRKTGEVTLNISTEMLKSLVVNGAVDFESRGQLNLADLKLVVNGSADIDIDRVTAENISLEVNGAADAEISGMECKKLTVNINGAGDCELSGRAQDAYISVSGAASVDARDLHSQSFNSDVHGVGVVRRR